MSRSTKSGIDHLVVIDPGSSKIKILDQTPCGSIAVHAIDPQAMQMTSADCAAIAKFNPKVPIENQLWVEQNDERWAVGNLARLQQASFGLHQLKEQTILPKLIAAVTTALYSRQAKPRSKIVVVGQLPAAEYSLRKSLAERLSTALSDFDSPVGAYKLKAQVDFLLEGSGIVAYREMIDPDFANKSIAFFMLGFRNAGAIVYQRGVPVINRSSKWGFSQLVSKVADQSVEQSIESLAPILVQALNPPFQQVTTDLNRLPFSKITHARSGASQHREIESLLTATASARDYYVRGTIDWMQSVISDLSGHCDEVILSGGTAEVLKSHFSRDWMQQFPHYCFHGGVKLPSGFQDQGLGVRWLDSYAVLQSVSARIFPQSV